MMLCYKIVSYRHQVNSVCFVFVKFKMANELKRFCVFVARCHVLTRLGNENDLSGVTLAAEFINSKLQRTIMFSISCFHLVIIVIYQQYQKNIPLVYLWKAALKWASLHQGSKYPLHRNNFLVSFSCHYDLVFYHPL